jgi:hypothetical protein
VATQIVSFCFETSFPLLTAEKFKTFRGSIPEADDMQVKKKIIIKNLNIETFFEKTLRQNIFYPYKITFGW